MSARVLVVDDLAPNRRLLEARLTAEYFDVTCAVDGPAALAACERSGFDLVLLDVMMPGMDGFEVCRRLKANLATAHVPVVMVTALDQPSDRVRGLDAGADDFLTKPVNETALLARVRSLVRLKAVVDELRTRALASRALGFADPLKAAAAETGLGGRILLVEDRAGVVARCVESLSAHHAIEVEADPTQAIFRAAEGDYDLVIVSLDLQGHDGLRVCAGLRSLERTRLVPVLMVAEADETARVLRGLDLGANDYLTRPIDRNELLARVRTQIRRHRFAARLRGAVQDSLEAAVLDALTGLHNRRYFDAHVDALVTDAGRRARPLALLMIDVDRFKAINDAHGHGAGDDVLREVARRVKEGTRAEDLVARYGGEEIVVVMPERTAAAALNAAERIRAAVGSAPFTIRHPGGQVLPLGVTVSVGVTVTRRPDERAADLFRRADEALYRAKREGRDRVIADAA